MIDISLSRKAEQHLTNLLNKVKCCICSNVLLTPIQSTCSHVACARCFLSKNECPVCKCAIEQSSLRPNDTLSKRTAAVVQAVKAYEAFSGTHVFTKPSFKDMNASVSEAEDSEDWFKKDAKYSKKYEKKKNESPSSKLMSVSQNDTPLVFPGEVINDSQKSIESEMNQKLDPIHKVQEWLSISQINVGATVFKGPVRNLYPNRMHQDHFHRKISDICDKSSEKKTRSSARLANKTPPKNKRESDGKSNERVASSVNTPTKSVRSTSTLSSKAKCRTPSPSKVAGQKRVASPRSDNQTDDSNNFSFKANDVELKTIFTKVLERKKMGNKEDIGRNDEQKCCDKDKNSWRNVRKMKRVLNHPVRPPVKKLDISVCAADNQQDKGAPLHKDVTQLIGRERHATPETVRRGTSLISPDSNCVVDLDSPAVEDKMDKDYLACQAAIIASKQLSPVPTNNDESISSEPPLTHLSPVSSNKAKNVKKIVQKLENEFLVNDILKDFEIEGDEGDSEFSEMSVVNSPTAFTKADGNAIPNSVNMENCDSRINIKAQIDQNLSKLSDGSQGSVPFVYRGRLHRRNSASENRKIPFYYKSKCTSKDWYQIPQNGLNLQLQRNNILTSISIRNQLLADVSQNSQRDSTKVVETRDAQTSPISFLTDGETSKPQSCANKHILPSSSVSYQMHPNLQRFTHCILPTINIVSANGLQNEDSDPIHLTDTPVEASSPPLIVSEPIPDSLFDTSRKRKLPQSFHPPRFYTKRIKNTEYPTNDNINVIFNSQSQTLNEKNNDMATHHQSSPQEKIVAGTKLSENTEEIIPASPNILDHGNVPGTKGSGPSDQKRPDGEVSTFVPSQRKTVEDETDLRIVSMEVEPHTEGTENIFRTDNKSQFFSNNTLIENDKTLESLMNAGNSSKELIRTPVKEVISRDNDNNLSALFDKNTVAFSQESHPGDNLVSKLNLPQSIQQLQRENSKFIEKSAERTVELSPHEQLLLTPSIKASNVLPSMDLSQQMCSPALVDEDSDSSMVEDTPQKTRRFTTVKKSVHESSVRSSDVKVLPAVKASDGDVTGSGRKQQVNAKKNDTPVSISKFSDDIKVCSTPVVCARRSLSYKENLSAISEDDELVSTLKKSNLHKASTSASVFEKELLEEAFDKSNGRNSTILGSCKAPTKSQPMPIKNATRPNKGIEAVCDEDTLKRICLACSCLNKAQVNKLKAFVAKMGWKFTSDYVDDLTHLVVKVDENNHSLRSIKYVQALAAGKWIVSYAWIEKCIQSDTLVPEEAFEVLDSSGEMGPYISRTRTSKIFEGFTFYCCPPFTVMTCDILISILKAAGGEVVETIEEIEVKDPYKISILLAEVSCTEDDRFLDLLMNHKIVPVNFEWVTECLGEGRLCNAGNNLLVPRSLLPTVHWSLSLMADESTDNID